ncbi:Peptidyl-prolyl cis-trans isomerase E [Porphyridium purpureum]|uniref:Peptidyl-prolyl cis-trans isomerase E n=1 Tax=Porphyridium purpureum TaxID=35688 RepID=A0A5J4Z4K4_PORPP|nr:Peptidyl-prolyl cis-trans isomerase E [Porphyridium purpureum]|eukprot:POR8595..scf295_1
MQALRDEHARNLRDGESDARRTCVFVGGLHAGADARIITAAFEPFGPIRDVSVPQAGAQQQPHRGIAFVTFHEHADAVAAVENMDQGELLGFRIHCRFARGSGGETDSHP